MVEKLTDPGRRVWPLVVLDLPAVIGGQRRGGETNRIREHVEVHGGHFPHLIDSATFNAMLHETIEEFWPKEEGR